MSSAERKELRDYIIQCLYGFFYYGGTADTPGTGFTVDEVRDIVYVHHEIPLQLLIATANDSFIPFFLLVVSLVELLIVIS